MIVPSEYVSEYVTYTTAVTLWKNFIKTLASAERMGMCLPLDEALLIYWRMSEV